jgi:toxin ParE1/3/4
MLDLSEIDEYTAEVWGEAQADLYLSRLADHFDLLAQMPTMGRKWNYSQSGLRRSEHGQHVIFYRETPGGIIVSRILHRSMLPSGRFS